MANRTGGAAVAERPVDSVWLSTLPTAPKPALSVPLPAVRAAAHPVRITRPAEGTLTGLPGSVTDLAVSHDGRHLVAAHYGQDAVSVIDVATLAVVASVSGIAEPYAVSIADRAYVRSASIAEDSVVAVDLDSGAQLAAREIGTGAHGLAVSPDGDLLYVARVTDEVADIAVIDIESGAVSTIPIARAAGASVDTVRINRAGTRLYAALTTATGGALPPERGLRVRDSRTCHCHEWTKSGDVACLAGPVPEPAKNGPAGRATWPRCSTCCGHSRAGEGGAPARVLG